MKIKKYSPPVVSRCKADCIPSGDASFSFREANAVTFMSSPDILQHGRQVATLQLPRISAVFCSRARLAFQIYTKRIKETLQIHCNFKR